jgi:hypothetical protein
MPGIPPCSATKANTPPPLPLSGTHDVGEGMGVSVGGRAVSVGTAVWVGGVVDVGLRVGGRVTVGWMDEIVVVRITTVCSVCRDPEQALRRIITSAMRIVGIRI